MTTAPDDKGIYLVGYEGDSASFTFSSYEDADRYADKIVKENPNAILYIYEAVMKFYGKNVKPDLPTGVVEQVPVPSGSSL